MFNVGGMELIVIGVVALVVLGPDKLPGAMRQLGTFVGEMRRISRGFQTDLRSALDEAERDAERERLAADQAARGSAPATNQAAGTAPDPGAAMAAAQAELDAIEAVADTTETDAGTDPERDT
jgi:sec-independent protein translocase protein TatB